MSTPTLRVDTTPCDPLLVLTVEGDEDGGGRREFQADFDTPTHVRVGTSLVRRPDAISLTYQTAYSVGPIELSNPFHSLLHRVWRIRAGGAGARELYLSRSSLTQRQFMAAKATFDKSGEWPRGSWEEEALLFTIPSGPGADEVDLAFGLNAEPLVCVERATGPGGAPEVWLYWYDSSLSAWSFERVGAGRNPRLLLDAPHDSEQADVLLFYADDGEGHVCWRDQRSRFTTVRATPIAVAGVSVEEVAMTEGWRVAVFGSHRDPATGTVRLLPPLLSVLYPVPTDEDEHPRITHRLAAASVTEEQVAAEMLGEDYPLISHAVAAIAYQLAATGEALEEVHPRITHLIDALTIKVAVVEVTEREDNHPRITHLLDALAVQAAQLVYSWGDDTHPRITHSINTLTITPNV